MMRITFNNLSNDDVAILLATQDDLSDGASMQVAMTGAAYVSLLANADQPDAGLAPAASAAAVFTAGTIENAAVFTAGTIENAAVPGTAAAVFAPAAAEPVMTDKATAPYQVYADAGWSDAQLVEGGFMFPKPVAVVAPPPASVTVAPPPTSNAGTPTPGATNPPLLDGDGLPWDAEIHSSGRSQTAAGKWTKKKNVQPAKVAIREAELRAMLAKGAPAATVHVPLVAPPPAANGGASVPVPPAPLVTGTVQPPPKTASLTDADPTDFVSFVRYATNNFKADEIAMVCQQNGVAGLGVVHSHQDKIPAMVAFFKALRT